MEKKVLGVVMISCELFFQFRSLFPGYIYLSINLEWILSWNFPCRILFIKWWINLKTDTSWTECGRARTAQRDLMVDGRVNIAELLVNHKTGLYYLVFSFIIFIFNIKIMRFILVILLETLVSLLDLSPIISSTLGRRPLSSIWGEV